MQNEHLLVSALAAKNQSRSVGTDAPVSIRLEHVTKGAFTSVAVTTATDVVITSDSVEKTYAFATYTTLGAVVDAINADGYFKAMVLDALRSDASASTIKQVTYSAFTSELVGNQAHSVIDLVADTSATKSLTVRVTEQVVPTLVVGTPSNWSGVKRPRITEIEYKGTLGSGGEAAGLRVYEVKGGTEVLRLSKTSISAADTQLYLNTPGLIGSLIDATPGNDLVVRLVDSVTMADAAANYLEVRSRVE